MCIITVTRLGTSPGYRFGKLHTKGWWLGSQTIKSLNQLSFCCRWRCRWPPRATPKRYPPKVRLS